MSDLLKCGIMGYGYMGEIRKRVIDNHPNLVLKTICEVDQSKTLKDNSILFVKDPNDLIQDDLDIIFICTPNYLIPKFTTESLKAGKHVFCEKPPGRNLNDIIKIRSAEKKYPGLKVMFGFNHRYHPAMLRVKSIVDSKVMGDILAVRGIYGKSGGKQFRDSWRNIKELSGGGILLDQGIHMLDLFNYFCGTFGEVKSLISNNYWKFDVEDNAMVILKNDKNQIASLHSSSTAWKHSFQIDLILEKGYLLIKGFLSKSGSYGRERLIIGHQQFEDEAEATGNPSEEIIYFDKDYSWETEVNLFYNFIKNDKPVDRSSSKDAFKVMKIIDTVYKENNLALQEVI